MTTASSYEAYVPPLRSARGWRVGPLKMLARPAVGAAAGLDATIRSDVNIDMSLAIGDGSSLDATISSANAINIDMLLADGSGGDGLSANATVGQTVLMDPADGSGGTALVPTLTIAQRVTGVVYTQSTVYGGTGGIVAATYANMNDGTASGASLATATNNATAGGEWVRADAGSSQFISRIVVGYDYLTNLGAGDWGATYTAGLTVQGSTNGTTFTNITTTPTYSGSPTDGLRSITIGATWRYIRLLAGASTYLVATEFQLWN